MGNNTVDSLQIEIEARSTTAASEIDRLAASLQRLQGATRQPGLERVSKQLQGVAKAPSMAALEKELSRVERQAIKDGDALLALQNKLEGLQQFKGIGSPLTIADTDSRISEAEWEIRELSAAVDGADAKIRTLKKSLETGGTAPAFSTPKAVPQLEQTNLAPVETAAKNVTEAFNVLNEAVRKVSDNLSSVSESANGLNGVTQRARETADGMDRISTAAKQADGRMEGVANSASSLGQSAQNIKRAAAGLEDISRTAKNIDANLDGATRSARQLGNTVEKAGIQGAGGLEKITDRLKRMAANFVILRIIHALTNSIGDSLGRMATENAKANETLSKIVSSLHYVADALGAAIYPIIVALQPIITTILDGLAEVLNFIARIVAFFAGQNYIVQARKQQIDYAESLNGTANSMQEVSNVAREMKRQLLGIDELNIFDKPFSGGGNSEGGLGDLRFEEIKNDFKLPEMIKSPVWSPNPIPAPQFEPVTLPEWSTVTLQSPAWEPSLILAPAFEDLVLPEWALSPLPVPEWAQNPIPSPAIDTTAVQSGLSQMEHAFVTAWSGIQGRVSEGVAVVQEKLHAAKQTIADFAAATQANFSAWGENVKTNFSAVTEYIPAATVPALQKSASTVVSYLSGTADGFMEWGKTSQQIFSRLWSICPEPLQRGCLPPVNQ